MNNPAGGDWGNGILMSRAEYLTAMDFDEAFGLRELRHKLSASIGDTNDAVVSRYSINAEFCYGRNSIEIVRRYLDTGVLEKHYEKHYNNGSCWTKNEGFEFTVLVACVMSLGCKLPETMRSRLQKMQHPAYRNLVLQKHPNSSLAKMKPLAQKQLEQALENYRDGYPYSYGNAPFLEIMSLRNFKPTSAKIRLSRDIKVIELTMPNGVVIPNFVGPPGDEEVGLKPVHPYHVCATCRAGEKAGSKLLVCGGCKDRKYCSKDCQKKHWKTHKAFCKALSPSEMHGFVQGVKHLIIIDDGSLPVFD
ncbi:hypothetical protein BDV96DRAFT_377107 [Lophiotrema nucula]|uniref:MYND-type domain-containing protein n=1 Tax=Lophiotrema nucula TaxID=690887 RepID=A0A6A5YE51_9PLEO|nr:hypothetical protein BDV96DRAFT_377107 [Lophiotrema nucula]